MSITAYSLVEASDDSILTYPSAYCGSSGIDCRSVDINTNNVTTVTFKIRVHQSNGQTVDSSTISATVYSDDPTTPRVDSSSSILPTSSYFLNDESWYSIVPFIDGAVGSERTINNYILTKDSNSAFGS